MSLFAIASAYLRARLSTTLLHITLMMLGVAMMTALLLFGYQMRERLYRDGAGIDVVVGAKGSPLQLILSSVQHVDIPTGNISLSEVEHIRHHPQVKQAIPISLGDSYGRFRIVGSEPEYLKHFSAEFADGKVWQKPMQAVIGATVARESSLKIGDLIVGSHGLVQGGESHTEFPYTVTGILKPTGTVLDRLVVTSLDSVWHIHEEHHHHHDEDEEGEEHDGHDEHAAEEHEHHHDEDHDGDEEGEHHHKETEPDEKEVTALLVTYKNRAAALTFPRQINKETKMQAASPVFEMARLVDLIGMGTDTIMAFGGFLVAVSLAGVFIGLLNSIRERRYDLAVFRTLGASRPKILLLVIMEGMTIAVVGSMIGLLAGHCVIEAMGMFTLKGMEMGLEGFIFLPTIYILWVVVLLLSFIACLIPAWEAYKTDIRSTLTHA